MPNSVIFLFVLTAITNIAGAQPMNSFQDHYTKFYSYSTNQGLSSSEVLDILEDQYGFIWVATKNGLNKFDGQEFFQYFKNTNPNSLPDNLVTSLAEDITGTIWIGTQKGLCRYVRSKNCFEIIASEPELPDLEIRALYADKKGNLWIETRRGGLNCYDISTKKLVTYPHRPLVFEGDYFYHFIFEDSKQRIWIGGRNFAPKYLNIETKTFAPSKAFRGNDGSSIFEDKNHIVWTSGNYGYTYFNEQTGNLDDSTQFQFPFRIQAALSAGDGKIWFGGDGDKVFLYDQNSEKWTFFSHSDTNPFSIISTKVNKIYNDNRDNIWIATSDGLSVCPSEINKFRHYRYIQGVSGSLSSNNATAILQDKTGTIWIGT
jgi:ligand-binding sensor domain-containing protein